MDGTPPLTGELTVVDLTSGIAGGYCTKLLVDGGAEVIKVEGPPGDHLRRRHLADFPNDPESDGVLFQFLAGSKASVAADPTTESDRDLVRALLRGADAVVWAPGSPWSDSPDFSPRTIRALAPRAVVLAMSPFGLVSEPSYPANEFTLQAMGGGACGRGRADREPLAVGGDYGDWVLGVFGAVSLLTAHQRSRLTGRGELVDLSALDAMHLSQTMFAPTFFAASGRPYRAARVRTIPLIHPTTDGYVGFQVTTGQQWLDFSAMVGRPDWGDDPTLTRFDVRIARYDEINAAIDDWTSARSTAEIVDLAVMFRIPVAPVGNGATVPEFEQSVARKWFVPSPTAKFIQPDVHYTFHGDAGRRPFGLAPPLGGDTERLRRLPPTPRGVVAGEQPAPLPFAGLRVADFTAFWAGPIISHYFAMLGADVIHVESTKRPDGIRAATLKADMSDGWWECSPTFAGTNTNKRDLTLDMQTGKGRELARKLVAQSDIVIENYSRRVMDHWGMSYDELRKIRPDLIMVRAPGFGIEGPWADRVAYATTIEQASGCAWVTGYADDRPDCAGGSLDPVAGTHAVFATLLALEHRRRTGTGLLVEVPQFASGFNITAEQTIEYSAHGVLLGRGGNRSWRVAPQGAYRVCDVERSVAMVPSDEWVAISVETDEQWLALCHTMNNAGLTADQELRTVDGRRRHHDAIDVAIGEWTRTQPAAQVIEALLSAGIPAALWVQSHELADLAEVKRRGLYEMVDNPGLGTLPIVGYPAQFEAGPHQMHRRRAPLLGEHNREILQGLLGFAPEAVDALEADGIIGTKAGTATAW